MLLTAAVVIGCGGSGIQLRGTYSIAVNGTSGNNSLTATYSLTVKKNYGRETSD
ncbi:hypothetical protein HNQ77_002622 [Silvibacterium bohemicum]|uniref:Uncharacterized protein n=1 Tax=Silvibacterium bohemicum TaxID=1577686 RepID=A0A841JTK9_9BACT|nr:hypothetical protein [Silvibacterium bohemicum]MBB6144666.1 hypothetical protein [Silvibacterium bohemicum]